MDISVAVVSSVSGYSDVSVAGQDVDTADNVWCHVSVVFSDTSQVVSGQGGEHSSQDRVSIVCRYCSKQPPDPN